MEGRDTCVFTRLETLMIPIVAVLVLRLSEMLTVSPLLLLGSLQPSLSTTAAAGRFWRFYPATRLPSPLSGLTGPLLFREMFFHSRRCSWCTNPILSRVLSQSVLQSSH